MKGKKKQLWFSVEGIIGAGKSTYIAATLEELQRLLPEEKIAVVPEPVKDWIDYLQKCGKDPHKYSYVTQTYIFHTKQKIFNKVYDANPDATIFISERSPVSDRHVFWDTNCELHQLDEIEAKTYPFLWETWNKLYPIPEITGFIYLHVPLDVALSRCLERGRECEKEAVLKSTTYQEMLLDRHHEGTFKGMLTVDATQNYRDDKQIAKECAKKLAKYIQELIY